MATPPPPPPSPPPPPPPPPPAGFCTVISESRRVLKAHSRHFLALSVLFLLPLSFAVTVSPTLHRLLLNSSSSSNPYNAQTLLRRSPLLRNQPPQQQQSSVDARSVLVSVGYTSFLTLLSVFAACSITHSVIQGFYGRPVKLLSAIKSIGTSFFPLLATLICTQVITSLIVIASGILGFVILKGAELVIGHEISHSSPYFLGLVASITVVLVLILAYLQVQWVLANVIVVAESGFGFYPLRRSAYLVKGMRGVALSLTLFFGVLLGVLVWTGTLSTSESAIDGNEWKRWHFVVQIVATTSSLTMLMLLSLAANVVLYMYCKAVHGELAMEIAEEFAREYLSLPFDDEKVPHVVSVAYAY